MSYHWLSQIKICDMYFLKRLWEWTTGDRIIKYIKFKYQEMKSVCVWYIQTLGGNRLCF